MNGKINFFTIRSLKTYFSNLFVGYFLSNPKPFFKIRKNYKLVVTVNGSSPAIPSSIDWGIITSYG
jgi:hypothetical protein